MKKQLTALALSATVLFAGMDSAQATVHMKPDVSQSQPQQQAKPATNKTTKTITLYNKKKVSVEFFNTQSVTSNKTVQKKVRSAIKGFVKETYSDLYKAGDKVTADYQVKSYGNIISIRAKFYVLNKAGGKLLATTNFNYTNTGKLLTVEQKAKSTAKVNSFLKKENKKLWGKAVGMPVANNYDYYFERSGAVVFCYPAWDLGKKGNDVYLTRVPKTYFK